MTCMLLDQTQHSRIPRNVYSRKRPPMKWGLCLTIAFLNLQRRLEDVDSHRCSGPTVEAPHAFPLVSLCLVNALLAIPTGGGKPRRTTWSGQGYEISVA